MSEPLRALGATLVQAALPVPFIGPRFVLRAELHEALGPSADLACEQSFKPDHDRLAAAGYQVTPRLEGSWPLGLVLLTRHKSETLANLARAWSLLEPGGWLIGTGANDIGAASIEKQLRGILGTVGGIAKHHCRVFWCRRTDGPPPEIFRDWQQAAELQTAPKTGFLARPGIFGWNEIDEGSALLAEQFTDEIKGRVGDLGAGWGFLGAKLIEHCPRMTRLDLYEAEALALDAARANLAERRPGLEIEYRWQDVTAGLPAGAYDWLVMNPPFHHGRAADPDLGRAFIRAAAAALVPGGKLLMVANRHLPYEATLGEAFKHWRKRHETLSFKMFEARK
jgi:16S rRNA (guanine1207-N2)-methyltransferase